MAAVTELNADAESLRAGTPLTVAGVTLLAIERVTMHSQLSDTGAWLAFSKQAYALVVKDAIRIRAIDIDAAEISLKQLCETVPGLDTVLANI